MTVSAATTAVHTILRARNAQVALVPELPLGSAGLGLDSIALVEVLLECEDRFGPGIAAAMLASPSLTVGTLVEFLETRGTT